MLGLSGRAAATVPGANGKLVFMGLLEQGIYTVQPDGGRRRQLTAGVDVTPSWSPDGNRIAYVDANTGNIWKMHADGSRRTRLTRNGTSFEPSWSPDGTRIVFTKQGGGDAEIYTMHSDGSHGRRVTDNDADDFDPDWSPNGEMIAFARSRSSDKPDLFKVRPSGSGRKRLTETKNRYEVAPSWAPDNRKIAFSSGREGSDAEIYKVKSDGTVRRQLTNNETVDADPAWSPNGNRIAFYESGTIWKMSDGGGKPRKVVEDGGWPDWQAR